MILSPCCKVGSEIGGESVSLGVGDARSRVRGRRKSEGEGGNGWKQSEQRGKHSTAQEQEWREDGGAGRKEEGEKQW